MFLGRHIGVYIYVLNNIMRVKSWPNFYLELAIKRLIIYSNLSLIAVS